MQTYDVVILGAGAAGMMCAIEAGRRGRSVLIMDHAKKAGEKIRISGGGRCNFTNVDSAPERFISTNPHFLKSVLRRYTPRDFIAKVEAHGIAYHEKTLGQLFCDDSAQQIIDMLLAEMREAGARLSLLSEVHGIEKTDQGFLLRLGDESIQAASLVVATGGKSIPKMGASGLAYEIAKQFDVPVVNPRPGLGPLTFEPGLKEKMAALAGVSVDAVVISGKARFREALLFTHRGLSGPSILQISSYWREGQEIVIDLAPGTDAGALLCAAKKSNGRQMVQTALSDILPKRVGQFVAEIAGAKGNLAETSDSRLRGIGAHVNDWHVKPTGTEGYRTAEVTLGGIDTKVLDQKTLMVRDVPGLYFIGEAVDVTGWLGGYNFQWAWTSGYIAGHAV